MLSDAAYRALASLIRGSDIKRFFRFQVLLENEINILVRTLKFSFWLFGFRELICEAVKETKKFEV